MRHAILIHAHHMPEQFGRLCRALRHPDFDIWANIDKKSDIEPFLSAAPQANFVRKRIEVGWGEWSQVEATLNSLEEIMASGREYGYILFISGQDYPVRPLGQIADYLEEHKGSEFISGVVPEQDPVMRKKWERRYTKRWLFIGPNRNIAAALSKKILHLFPSQKLPYAIYKGSNWWNLTSECARYLLDYRKKNPGIIRSYRHSLCADEMFFQSTLMASPLAGRLVNRNFRYIAWTPAGPRTLGAADHKSIAESDAWFCRKVDMYKEPALLDMLDEAARCEAGPNDTTG